MKSKNMITTVSVILGVFALIMSFMAILAMIDITQGAEPNLELEWITVWITIIVVIISQVISIFTILKLRFRKDVEKS